MRWLLIGLTVLAGGCNNGELLRQQLLIERQQREIDGLKSQAQQIHLRGSQYVPSRVELEAVRKGQKPIVVTEAGRQFWVDAGELPPLTVGDFQR